jgi:predicted permease
MNILRRFKVWFRALFQKRKLDAEMDEEIRSHIELRTEANIEAGMNPKEAHLAALRQFGWTDLIKEKCRDQRGVRWIENVLQDVRFGARQLRQNAGFTIVAVLTLALGIGANTFVFSVLNSTYLRPLPFHDPGSLVHVAVLGKTGDFQKVSFPQFVYLRDNSETLHSISALQAAGINLTAVDEPSSLQASHVSAGFFEFLGIQPLLGRTFVSSEHEVGANHVVVLGYWVWQRNFSGARDVVGRIVELNREAYRIIGVLPPDFSVPVEAGNSEIWLPMAISPADLQNDNPNVSVVGRLKTGKTIGQAKAEMKLTDERFRQLRQVSPDVGPLSASILNHQVDRGTSLFLGMLSVAVVFVLMIGCANVASLSISRSLARRKEIVIRFSLGATRCRIIQQLLFEGLLLGCLGGSCGVLLAFYSTNFAANWIGEPATFDRHVLFFSGAACFLAGILCGLFPAILATRVSLSESLKDTACDHAGTIGPFGMRRLFVVCQVAMSVTLLLGVGLMIRSLVNLALRDPGFKPKDLLSVQVYLPTEKYKTDIDRNAFFEQIFRDLHAIPGVRGGGGTSSFPIYAPTFSRPFVIAGQSGVSSELQYEAEIDRTTASYLNLMGIGLSEGRYFTAADRNGSEGVAIVDETFKRRFLRDRDPIGAVLDVDADSGVRKTFTIIGVARNVMNVGNQYELDAPRATVYVPFEQFPPTTMTILAQVSGDPNALLPHLKHLLRAADADLPIRDIRPVEERIHEAGSRTRQMLGILAVFALSALILSAIGIFGVISLSVLQRTREIGIRMALGASRSSVQTKFVKQGFILTCCGVALGTTGAFALTRQIQSLLYGVRSNDPLTYFGAAFIVLIVALGASYFPARRAALVEPVEALRQE